MQYLLFILAVVPMYYAGKTSSTEKVIVYSLLCAVALLASAMVAVLGP